jgi:hypothetical protein
MPPTFSDIPPPNFNISDFVFRPGQPYVARPGLRDSTENLLQQERYVSALKPLLAILAESPRDQEALTLALLVVGRARTQQVQANEALSQTYLLDRRLDPIFAVCSKCKRSSWAPVNCLLGSASRITNPIGAQCRSCGYVVCRKCLQGRSVCLNCGSADFRAPVYPTGRQPHQLERRPQPVVAAIVLREGPIPPDAEWIQGLLALLSPDVLESPRVRISAHPVHPWRDDTEHLAYAIAARLINEGETAARMETAIAGSVTGQDRIRAYLLKLYA